jgi:S1-C subfamily serine protease
LDVLRKTLAVITLAFLCCIATAQVAPPKHESNFAHVKHSRAENYSQRFDAIKCALVLIRTPAGVGTGVFISSDGDIATASHVLGDRTFKSDPDGTIEAGINMPPTFTITDCHGTVTDVPSANVEKNGDTWGTDLAVLRSGVNTNCWLLMGPTAVTNPGEPLITMGFPGLAWGSLSIYTGIVSVASIKLDLIIGFTDTRQPVKPKNDFIQVQMPISTGLSGSPIINDENRIIGIVTMAGASTTDIDLLIQLHHLNAFAVPQPMGVPPPPAGQQQVTLNVFSLLAELAESLKAFASPGYGDAVPIRYLKREPPHSQQAASPAH